MKKVLALVLAVVMVCIMAFAVSINPGTPATPGTTTEDKTAVITNIEPGSTVALQLIDAKGNFVNYYTKDGKFVPANNVVTLTFAKGAEYVKSQGWVKVGTTDGTESYEYQITFKEDLTKAKGTEAEIVISGVSFKATGYNAVTLLKATKNSEMLGYTFGFASKELTVTEGDTSVGVETGAVNSVVALKDKNGKDVSALEVTNAGMTYTLTKGMKFYVMNGTITFDTTKDKGYTGVGQKMLYTNLWNVAAKVSLPLGADANNTYKVYAKTADGKVLAVAATTTDGVMSFTVPAMSAVLVTTETLTTSGTTGTTTGTTTNPGTGANDVVGVAAALAVVALVSGAAISLKK